MNVDSEKAAKQWIDKQVWSLGNQPNWNMMHELERAFKAGAKWQKSQIEIDEYKNDFKDSLEN